MYLGGQWYFIDIYWASPYSKVLADDEEGWAHLESGEIILDQSGEQITLDLDEFFFMTDPDQFMYLHLPKDPQWQLLEEPLTREEFASLAYVERPFFALNMTVRESSKRCIIIPVDGEADLDFGIPQETAKNLRYSYTYFKKTNDSGDDDDQTEADRYVMYQKTIDALSIKVRFPFTGEYKLEIYGGTKQPKSTIISLKLLVTYIFKCSKANENVQPFPASPGIGWGPGLDADKVGLDALSHKDAFIKTSDGNIDIRFGVTDTLAVLPSLFRDDLDDVPLPVLRHVICYKHNNELVVNVRLPQQGEYTLKLFGDAKRKQTVPNICNYLLQCATDDINTVAFPRLHTGVLGMSHLAPRMGIEASIQQSHILETPDGTMKIAFICPEHIELVVELHSATRDANVTAEEVTISRQDTITSFDIALTKPGEYGFNVFALRKGDSRVYHIHTYLLLCRQESYYFNREKTLPFNIVQDARVHTIGSEMQISLSTHGYPMVAELQKLNAFEPPPNIELAFLTDDNIGTFHLKNLPVFQKYKLDIYERRGNGTLVHIHGESIVRQPGKHTLNSHTTYIYIVSVSPPFTYRLYPPYKSTSK